MDATTIGLESNSIVLGKHSGRHALRDALEQLGFQVDGASLNTAFKRFKELADKKKTVSALDLEAIVSDEMLRAPMAFELESFDIEASSVRGPLARVAVRLPDGELSEGSFTGDGPIDAFFSALNAATGHEGRLKEYHVSAVTGGRDALGETTVLLELDGELASGQGVSTDILEASGRAYLRALSNALAARARKNEAEPEAVAATTPWGSGPLCTTRVNKVPRVDPRGSFTWIDSERLIRYGPGASAQAPELLTGRGFEQFA